MFHIKVFVLVAIAICLVQSCSVEEPKPVQSGCSKSECSTCGKPEGSCGCVKNCGCGGRPRRSPCSCSGCSKN
ncbi:hypothetical protein KR032_004759 [Drosophila birchii]|nr:hypothetical protein KR032_004759 [Drosophila birchii]